MTKTKFNIKSIGDVLSNVKLRTEYKKSLGAEENVDVNMIGESITNYLIAEVDYTNKVCLDLGANIGGFSKIALDFGASKVVAVECDSRNFNMLKNSFKDSENIELIHGAISSTDDTHVKLYKGDSKSKHCSTTTVHTNSQFKEYEEVQAVNFNELIKKYSPDIIKIDIEGAEYQILEDVLAYYPDVLFMEFHSGGKKFRDFMNDKVQSLIDKYPINKIEPLHIYHNPYHGYDCFFKKTNHNE